MAPTTTEIHVKILCVKFLTPPFLSPERPAHRLIVHVGLVLVHPPQSRNRLAVHQLEYALEEIVQHNIPKYKTDYENLFTVAPFDKLGTALRILEIIEM